MASFVVSGQRFAVNREVYKLKIGRESEPELERDLANLMQLERDYNNGIVECSEADWDEVVGIALDVANEIGVRSLLRGAGITLEVR